jgi:type II secretory pathway component PulM
MLLPVSFGGGAFISLLWLVWFGPLVKKRIEAKKALEAQKALEAKTAGGRRGPESRLTKAKGAKAQTFEREDV